MVALPSSETLLLVAAKSTLLLVLALAVRGLLARRSAALRHLVAMLGLGSALLLPLVEPLLPDWRIAALPPAAGEARAATTLPAAPAPEPEPPYEAMRSSTVVSAPPARSLAAASPSLAPPARPTAPDPEPVPEPRRLPTAAWLLAVWLAGTLLLLARVVSGLRRTARISAAADAEIDPRVAPLLDEVGGDALLGRVEVRSSSRVPVPFVWGAARPLLLLPEAHRTWSEERLRLVLGHELAHVARGDWPALLVGRWTVALFWWQPLAWLLDAAASRDREEACDDLALSLVRRPSDYAEHLLALAGAAPPVAAPDLAVPFARASRIERRLRAILRTPRPQSPPTRRASLVIATVAAALTVAVASVRPVAADVDRGWLWTSPGGLSGPTTLPIERLSPEPVRLAQAEARPTAETRQRRTEANERKESKATKRARSDAGAELWSQAYSAHRSRRYAEAIELFERAAELGYRPAGARYNVACGWAGLGDADRALAALQEAAGLGFEISDYLEDDSDLDPIRADPRFRALRDAYPNTKEAKQRRKQERRLAEAKDELAELERSGSRDGGDWHGVGTDLLSAGEPGLAVAPLERAVELLGEEGATATYNLACARSLAGDVERALDDLERAVLAGFDNEERFENDDDLDPLRSSPRFSAVRRLHDDLSLDRYRVESRGRKKGGEDTEFSPERWAPAVAFYRDWVESHPEIGRGWFDLGWALHYSGEHAEAAEAFARAGELGFRPATTAYDVACAEAMAGRSEAAFAALDRAAALGFDLDRALHDRDLESLWDDERFDAIAARAWRVRLERERRSD